ncbi:MAG: hypothetical protein ACLFQB_01800 [Chitinispirillaceae bacterium]
MKKFSPAVSEKFVKMVGIAVLFSVSFSLAGMMQPRRLVDGHTAGVLPKSYYDLECRVYAAGDPDLGSGLNLGISVGLTDRLTLGVMYGGEGLIGRSRNVRFNSLPGVLVKYRLFEERVITPGLSLGYDHQGYGGMADTAEFGYEGFVYKSPGFFLALSKNYIMLNLIQIGFHGTVNYSLEERETVCWPNFSAGLDIGINEEMSFVVEYDFALNDKSGKKEMYYALPHRGLLNAGLRWAFSPNFHFEFDFKDLLENKQRRGEAYGWSRELKLLYYSRF